MAEGFISTTSTEVMEGVAYSCFRELVERCMIQVGEIGSSGKIKTCRLHDLMRDLCLLKAKEENFVHIVNMRIKQVAPIGGKVRRLAIYLGNRLNIPTRDGHLRSLLYFSPRFYWRIIHKKDLRPLFKNFKLLRVLKLEGMIECRKLPSAIGNLVHLRYLSVKDSGIKQLPSCVANLIRMQTLDIRSNAAMTVSNVFKNLEQLRHLYLPLHHRVRGEKLSLAMLCNLQTLVNVRTDDCNLNDFVELASLTKLYIRAPPRSNYLEKLDEILKSRSITFNHLRSLTLLGDSGGDIVLRSPFIYKLQLLGLTRLPEELLGYPNLVKIQLYSTHLEEDQIELLEKLPKLRVLYLEYSVFASLLSNTLVCSAGGFPRLEFLSIRSLRELREWTIEEGAMPRLRRLNIYDCQGLRALPDGLQHISTLNELVLKQMPNEFCIRLDEGGEDFYKIKNVPSVIITEGRCIREFDDHISFILSELLHSTQLQY